MTDKTGKILPEAAVDCGNVHPIESGLHLCCHTGVQIQIFVQIVGPSISVQVTHESTIEAAVCLAMSKTNCKIKDFYIQCENRLLDLDKSFVAENIVRDSTIRVFTRLRGGSSANISHITLIPMPFNDWINSLPEDKLFQERIVPINLIGDSKKIRPGRSQKGSEYFLLELGTQTFHKLFEMIALNHDQGKSLNGNFTSDQIRYIPLTGSCIIDPEYLESNTMQLTPQRYEKDLESLGKVLDTVCKLKFMVAVSQREIYPAYVKNFLDMMKSMPKGAKKSDTFKMFMRNHPCMMSPTDRHGLISKVHKYISRYQKTASMLGSYNWTYHVRMVPAFQKVFDFSRAYDNTEMSWFDFCRNFLEHPNGNQCPDFSMEDADLALSYHFEEHLADYLCSLSYKHQFNSPHNFADVFC